MNETRPLVEIVPMRAEDVDRVATLAGEIWRAHYPAIVSHAQIEYMLGERYNRRVMLDELQRADLWWDVLLLAGEHTGFASYFLTDEPGEMKLDKLYVHQQHQRKGFGGLLIERCCKVARAQGCKQVILAVNKRNASAIAAYRKHGFDIARSVVKDIGDGFVMDDFIMAKPL